MPKDHPAKTDSAQSLALVVHAKAAEDGSVSLFIDEITGDATALMGTGFTPNMCGRPLPSLMPFEGPLITEWTEFIVKCNAYPSGDGVCGVESGVFSRPFLQFLQLSKKWMLSELSFHIKSQVLRVAMRPISELDDTLNYDIRQIMDMRQDIWLNDFISSDSIWEIDLKTQTIFLAEKLAKTLQLAEGAVVVPLSRFLSLVHPDDIENVENALKNVGKTYSAVYNRGILSDGSTVHFNSFAIPSYNKSGALTRIIGKSENISEAEYAREQLLISERLFRGIVESSSDIFIVLDTTGDIKYVSPNVFELFGHHQEELIGHKFNNFMMDEKEASVITGAFSAVVSEGRNKRGECRLKSTAGDVFWFTISISPILGPDGGVHECVAVLRNVTEDKQHEQHLYFLATHDPLTGVYSRMYFEDELDRIEREKIENVGLVLTDLNGLKLINDAFGHQTGDEMLIKAGKLLSDLCGESRVSRIGGDEFAVFLYDCNNISAIDKKIDKIMKACREAFISPFPLSMSCGGARRKDATQSMQEVYKRAEGRMYSSKLIDSRSMHNQALAALKEALKSRDVETSDHMLRMENMVMALGKRLGLPGSEFDRLVLLASMHDIGKVAIPDNIINKPASLSADEWTVMKTHSEIGCRIALASPELSNIANEICCHHERYDGKGYPYGYPGDKIPLLSRIISVVDTYDVMTHKRVYKDAVSHIEAIEELKRCAGTQFDPEIVKSFVEIFGSLEEQAMRTFVASDTVLNKKTFRTSDFIIE